jgi:hypothetical protein
MIHLLAASVAAVAIVIDVSGGQVYPRNHLNKQTRRQLSWQKDALEKGSTSQIARIAETSRNGYSDSSDADGMGYVR